MSIDTKKRSRRLSKKLHLGEFKEMGFEFSVDFKNTMPPEEEEALAICFISEAIEPRHLDLGGWVTSGFIAYAGRGSVSEADRETISTWLHSRHEIKSVRVGQLVDAWYPPA